MNITNGSTRTVILTKKLAIKLPIFLRVTDAGAIARSDRVSYRMFKNGVRANRKERETSRLNHPKLCPILFVDPFGLVVIMPRCSRAPRLDHHKECDARAICPVEYEYLRRSGLPIDNYAFNYGLFRGRVVSFDYGTSYYLPGVN